MTARQAIAKLDRDRARERARVKESRAWFRGHCAALAHVATYDGTSIPAELLHAAGVYTVAQALKAGAEQQDVEALRTSLADARDRRRCRGSLSPESPT